MTRLRGLNASQAELNERAALLGRPWQEDILHWSYDGKRWHLHGTLLPPPGWKALDSVTHEGWCPGRRAPRRPQ